MNNHRLPRLVHSATAAVLAGLLSFPTGALAAHRVVVWPTGGTTVECLSEDGPASGDGWSWDGADDMELNGFTGPRIYAQGDLTITLIGENTMLPINGSTSTFEYGIQDLSGGHLTITGDGSLDTLSLTADSGVEIIDTTVRAEQIRTWNGTGDITISNSSVDLEGENAAIRTEEGSIIIDSSHVHVVNTGDYPATVIASPDGISLTNVEGDTQIENSELNRQSFPRISGTYATLNGEDGNQLDILIDPIPEDVSEEKTITRTITYVFEDGSEAAATKTDTQTLTRSGKKNPLTEETTWEDWSISAFADVESPVIEGYTAKLVLVAGESVTADSDDLVYEVVYVKDEEPAPDPEPAPEPEPVKVAVVPQTGDAASAAQAAQGIAAGVGTLLSAAGVALKRRED